MVAARLFGAPIMSLRGRHPATTETFRHGEHGILLRIDEETLPGIAQVL